MSDELNTMSVEIARLSLRPGDVLVVKSEEILSDVVRDRIKGICSQGLPDAIKVLVIDRSLSLAVLTREEIEARAA